jgi:long-subunit acyl-CoA synthetase (AMP-forming)
MTWSTCRLAYKLAAIVSRAGGIDRTFSVTKTRLAVPSVGTRGAPANIDQETSRILRVQQVTSSMGVLEVRGAVLFSKYYNDTVRTKAAFTSDSWFKTGL